MSYAVLIISINITTIATTPEKNFTGNLLLMLFRCGNDITGCSVIKWKNIF